MPEQHAGELTVKLTPKIVKMAAEVELYADGRCVGTATVDLTPPLDADAMTPDIAVTAPTIVVAQNAYRADLIAEKLGIDNPITTSARNAAAAVRGIVVTDIVIDDECTGIDTDTMNALREALTTPGLIMRYVDEKQA